MKLTIFLFLFATMAHAETKLSVKVCALDSDFGVFTNRQGTGLWQNKISAITSKLPIIIEYHYAPRLRCLFEAKTGVSDAVFAADTPEREAYLTYPRDNRGQVDSERAVGRVRYHFYKLKNSKVDWDGKNILNAGTESIGVQRGIQTNDLLKLAGIKHTNIVETPEQVLSMLNVGRSAAAIVEETQGEEILKKDKYQNIISAQKMFYESSVYLAFSPKFYQKNQETLSKLWSQFSEKSVRIPSSVNKITGLL